jgi:hypothetical protein
MQFVGSPPSVHPVLIIGYEMFRNYATLLNEADSLEVLVCDEGHRLKNAYGTSTSLALGNCCAMRRLVLTGNKSYCNNVVCTMPGMSNFWFGPHTAATLQLCNCKKIILSVIEQ